MILWLEGLPGPIVALMTVALFLSFFQLFTGAVLAIKGRKAMRVRPDAGKEEDYLWVFFVPALNEEVTIADTVQRLLDVSVTNRIMLIIDDGSTDETANILAQVDHPDLLVLSRTLPNARTGKGSALNAAWRTVNATLEHDERWASFDPANVLVTVVDADGRLDPDFSEFVSAHFDDPGIGGVQLRVDIYNNYAVLTRLQDIEFDVYGALYQIGRTGWGDAGMGGNGQINRLSALNDVAVHNGQGGPAEPWRDRLTEDQDLAISLLAAKWRTAQELRGVVRQQGLNNPKLLLRQRTRWAQGCFQACRRIMVPLRSELAVLAKVEYVQWLLQPLIQFYLALMTVITAALIVIDRVNPIPFAQPWMVLFVLFLSLGGSSLGCVVALTRTKKGGVLKGLYWAIPYALYSAFLTPAFLRAMYREVTGRSGWAKTSREPLVRASKKTPAATSE